MAETLRKLVEKKRFHSSSSEESSPLPLVFDQYKKPRSEDFAFIDATDHKGVTVQSPALEMAEKLDEKRQAILTKLEKLDAIEKSVKILQETLAGMDSRIQSLESAQASAYRDINDLKESLNFAEDKCKKTTECINEYKQQISLEMTEMEQKGTILEGKITELENKNLYLEAIIPGAKILNLKTSKRYQNSRSTMKTLNACFATQASQTHDSRNRSNIYDLSTRIE